LQQLYRLTQLRRHHQRLCLSQVKARTDGHGIKPASRELRYLFLKENNKMDSWDRLKNKNKHQLHLIIPER
jgi:hypothetical protein